MERSVRCAEDHGLNGVVVVGGVSANGALRERLQRATQRRGLALHLARPVHRQRRHDWAGRLPALPPSSSRRCSSAWRPVGHWVRPMPCMGRHRFEQKFALR